MEHLAIQWKAYEYEGGKKTSDWYVAFGIITLSLLITAILFNNILLAIILLASAIAIILYTLKAPPLVSFEINERGVMVNKRLYPFNTLQSFALVTHPFPKLYIRSKKKLVPHIVIPFDSDDHDYIHDFLIDFLSEEEGYEENLTETIINYLGF